MSTNEADTSAASRIPKLTPLNWTSWNRLLRLALRGRGLLDTIDPNLVPGPNADPADPEVIDFRKREDRTAFIIGFSLSPSIQNRVIQYDSPLKMLEVARRECMSSSFTNTARLLKDLILLGNGPKDDMRKHMDSVDNIFENLVGVGYALTEEAKMVHLLVTLPASYAGLSTAMDVLGRGATYQQLQIYIVEEEQRQRSHKQPSQQELALAAAAAALAAHEGSNPAKGKTCHYCKKTGHFKRDCRQKERDEKKNKGKGKNDSASYANEPGSPTIYMGQALISSDTQGTRSQLTFVVDSGATRHIVNDRQWFTRLEPVEAGRVITTANGASMPIEGVGTVVVELRSGQRVSIRGAAYVPSAVHNLLSVDMMADDGYLTTFGKGWCRITRADTGVVIETGRNNGQHVLDARRPGTEAALTVQDRQRAKVMLVHERHGHLGAGGLIGLARRGVIDRLPLTEAEVVELLKGCGGCKMGKQSETPIPTREHSRSDRPGAKWHADIFGPVEPAAFTALGGSRFGLLLEDDHSRYLLGFPMQFKAEAAGIIIDIFQHLEKMYPNRPIAILKTDNGAEFVNQRLASFLRDRGISHQRSAPYTPQSNGVIERANRTVIEMTRAMLQGRNLDGRLWSAAFQTAVYIRNRSPTRALTGNRTPAEVYLGARNHSAPLRVFGSSCWVLDVGREGKFAAKSAKMTFIGYLHSDTYRLWDEQKQKVVVSRHVNFDEADRAPRRQQQNITFQAPEQTAVDIGQLVTEGAGGDSGTDPRFAARLQEAQHAVRQQVAAAQTRARELMDQRERAEREQQEVATAHQQRQAVEQTVATGNSPQEQELEEQQPERRTSRRLAGEEPEVDVALAAYAVKPEPKSDFPRTVKEAREREDWPQWKKAIQLELDALKETGTYKLVRCPNGANVLTGKWVLTIKYNADGSVNKYKARWVARGYSQIEGVDYDETHAPTARMGSVRMVGAWSACNDLELSQWDYTTAYLNGLMGTPVYILPPEGVRFPKGWVWLLVKALYGLKQSGREWNIVLVEFLVSLGFKQSKTDASLFVRTDPSFVAIIVYVDDLVIAAAKGTDMGKLKSQLASKFKGKDLGDAHHVLGIKIERNRVERTLTMSQGRYARQVLERFGMESCKPARTPMESKINLLPRQDGEEQADIKTYRAIVGSLMYLAQGTRPDLAYAVSVLGRYASDPSESHLLAAKRVLRYLKGTADARLTYDGKRGLRPIGYVDADWAGDRADRKSTSGFAFLMAGAAVTWGSKKQTAVATSTTEAEYVAAGVAGKEGIALTAFLNDLGADIGNMEILCDNQAAISVTKNPVLHSRTKHIDITHHWLRDAVNQGQLRFSYVRTDDNPADTLTKALAQVKTDGHRARLGVVVDGDAGEKE